VSKSGTDFDASSGQVDGGDTSCGEDLQQGRVFGVEAHEHKKSEE
jgi:hypothetical protein